MVGSPRNEATNVTILAFLHDTPPQIQVTPIPSQSSDKEEETPVIGFS